MFLGFFNLKIIQKQFQLSHATSIGCIQLNLAFFGLKKEKSFENLITLFVNVDGKNVLGPQESRRSNELKNDSSKRKNCTRTVKR